MDRATIIRGKVLSMFDKLTLDDGSKWDALNFNDTLIPVFDDVVNPKVSIPSVGDARQVYIVLQDQQTSPNAVQPYCYPRFDLSLTIRVVTTWGTTGSKKLCEDIGQEILDLLCDDRGNSYISGINKIELVTAQSIVEHTNTELGFSKIIILNFIQNG